MCVAMWPADFSATALVVSHARHPVTGKNVHVLTYRNTAVNLADGANAMMLHFPAHAMGRENVVDTEPFAAYVDRIIEAVRPRRRTSLGSRELALDLSAGVEVFEHDIYTIVLAERAGLIEGALSLVPEDRRPNINSRLFAWYDSVWPNWPVALCCFNNRDAAQANPMMWWYRPLHPDRFMAPAVDCHTGEVPDLAARVDVDHWVVAGFARNIPGLALNQVDYNGLDIPDFARGLLPNYVVGQEFRGSYKNDDFLIPVNQPSMILRSTVTA